MALRGFFYYLAWNGTRDSSNRDPEIGLEILPEDTLDEVPSNDRNDVDDDGEALNEEEANYVEQDATEDPLDVPQRHRRFSSAPTFTTFSRSFTLVEQPTWLQKVKSFVFPPKEDIDSFVPNFRHTPIISGLLIPFSILLEIPGLTEHWYIRTENNQIVEHRSNPALLNAGLGISLACAVIANICLITRFLEQRVKTMTILCVIFLVIHDLINIVAATVFGVEHRFNDGFTYGQSFWMTVCSTVASSVTTATLIWDLYRTPDFNKSGSGLTRRQRTLVIIIMVLFCYICVGALINSLLQKLTFINGLYFTLVSIETIGFGDIVPKTTGARVFVCVYSAIGFLNLGVAIGMCRETVLEAMEVAYRKRARKVKERWKDAREKKHIESRWRRGIEWRLKEMGVPVWIRDENWHRHRTVGGGRSVQRVTIKDQNRSGFLNRTDESAGSMDHRPGHSHIMHGPTGMRLNVNALTHAQLEAAALEAGGKLDALLPPDLTPAVEEMTAHHADADAAHNLLPGWIHHPLASHFEHVFHPTEARSQTHARLGGMSALLTRFAVAIVHRHATTPDEHFDEGVPTNQNGIPRSDTMLSGEASIKLETPTAEEDKGLSHLDFSSMIAHSSDNLDLQTMQDLDTKAFYSKLIIAWSLFFVFWTVGSAIFMATEGWSYGISMYFCFVAFTTIGYGDYYPATPAGRSVFVVWAILGVGTMTVLISIVQEAYGSRYKNAMHIRAFDKAVKRYRERIHNTNAVSGRRGRRLNSKGHTTAQADPSEDQAKSTSRSSSVSTFTQAHAAAEKQKAKVSESHTRAQKSLEALPHHVLHHAKTFHTYIRLFVDEADTQNGGSADGTDEVSGTLRRLLDRIAVLGGIGRGTKEEIMRDPDARHTLFVLGIEKALYKMIEAAEGAMEAIQERDELVAQVQQQQPEANDPDPEEDNGTLLKVAISTPGEVSAQEHKWLRT